MRNYYSSSFLYLYRNRIFYGRKITEGIQMPSETVYMPNMILHAVYNLDETVAVGDNPFYNTALEEAAYQLALGHDIWFAQKNGSRPLIYESKFYNNSRTTYNIIHP